MAVRLTPVAMGVMHIGSFVSQVAAGVMHFAAGVTQIPRGVMHVANGVSQISLVVMQTAMGGMHAAVGGARGSGPRNKTPARTISLQN